MTPTTISIYLCIAVLAIGAQFSPKLRFILYLGAEWTWLEIKRLPLKAKLWWDIQAIKRDKNRYLNLAEEILNEINQQRADADQEHPEGEESLPGDGTSPREPRVGTLDGELPPESHR